MIFLADYSLYDRIALTIKFTLLALFGIAPLIAGIVLSICLGNALYLLLLLGLIITAPLGIFYISGIIFDSLYY